MTSPPLHTLAVNHSHSEPLFNMQQTAQKYRALFGAPCNYHNKHEKNNTGECAALHVKWPHPQKAYQ